MGEASLLCSDGEPSRDLGRVLAFQTYAVLITILLATNLEVSGNALDF